jgi:hypothetical protein
MLAAVPLGMSPTVAVAVGAGAGMAASSGLLFSPVLFAALLVGSAGQDAVPAAVLASVAAWLTVTALEHRRPTAPSTDPSGPTKRRSFRAADDRCRRTGRNSSHRAGHLRDDADTPFA